MFVCVCGGGDNTHANTSTNQPKKKNTEKVKTIIVCGHYNCGAVKAALWGQGKGPGLFSMADVLGLG